MSSILARNDIAKWIKEHSEELSNLEKDDFIFISQLIKNAAEISDLDNIQKLVIAKQPLGISEPMYPRSIFDNKS